MVRVWVPRLHTCRSGGVRGGTRTWVVSSAGLVGALEPVTVYMRLWVSIISYALCFFKAPFRPPHPRLWLAGFHGDGAQLPPLAEMGEA